MDCNDEFYDEIQPVIPRPNQMKVLVLGLPRTGEDFDRILWNYDAVTDDPCCLFIEELIDAYPEAKVILTLGKPAS
ncbi:hypothetical protein HRG_008108 [Hirsutella rhossiliensis]|uniref:Uncharacterized protein n=1 Tax=Hirsutella rhossiliensis TaxID=111463 RepID=A0A9P8MTE8_9HYPO|nr:uncharacterized protein HRG_08108 [Hirsutella rhossiliensis]KAH0960955.1 hypothetical protein HRG_08108 [Hirsutella rhossiliensis]